MILKGWHRFCNNFVAPGTQTIGLFNLDATISSGHLLLLIVSTWIFVESAT